MLNELKSAQKSEIPKTDACTICTEKLPAGSLYEHLCIETDDEDGNIKCAYCTRSFRATIALTEHLKFSHMIKSYAVRCDECEQHYAMKELLQVHMMAKHKRKVSKIPSPQSNLKSPISMSLNDGTESIELEPEESVERNIEQSIETLESPRCTTTNYQTPKRRKLDGESSTNSGHSYSSDANDMAELLPSNEYSNEQITNHVNNKPQLRRLKIIKKKNTIESTSFSGHLPAEGETIKITVEPLPIAVHEDNPLLKRNFDFRFFFLALF